MRISDYLVSESARPKFDKPPHIKSESVLLIGDTQCPYHDAAFINRVKALALAWGVKRACWMGDIMDLSAFSIFINAGLDAEHELDETETALAELASGFDRIDWLWGNHEDRLQKQLGAWLSADRIRKLMGLDTNVVAHNYYHCLIGDDWIAAHPKNISVIPARAVSFIAEKYSRNVAAFHSHVCGQSQTRDGRHLAIDVGMCADPQRLEYNMIRLGSRPAMVQGALILRYDGEQYYPHHLTRWTDWDFEMRGICQGTRQSQKRVKRRRQ